MCLVDSSTSIDIDSAELGEKYQCINCSTKFRALGKKIRCPSCNSSQVEKNQD